MCELATQHRLFQFILLEYRYILQGGRKEAYTRA